MDVCDAGIRGCILIGGINMDVIVGLGALSQFFIG